MFTMQAPLVTPTSLLFPSNTSARAGALVWINLLLSAEAQADKASPSVWGDPTVIDVMRLSEKIVCCLNRLI